MSLRLSPALLKEVEARAEAAFPEECCGFVIGPPPDDFDKPGRAVVATETRALPNGWEAGARTHRYQIDPKIYAKTEAELADRGLAVVGFYHSHPSVPAWPSPFDLERAWPCCSYWIVRVDEGKAKDSRSWMRSEDGRSFTEEEIIVAKGK
jgi:proteasome lid subunit RPN8/RPN11